MPASLCVPVFDHVPYILDRLNGLNCYRDRGRGRVNYNDESAISAKSVQYNPQMQHSCQMDVVN